MSAPGRTCRLRRFGRVQALPTCLDALAPSPWASFGHESTATAASGAPPSTVGCAVPWFTLVRPCSERFTLAEGASVAPLLHADVAGGLDEVAGPGRPTLCGPSWLSVVNLRPTRPAGRAGATAVGRAAGRGCFGVRRRRGRPQLPRATEVGPTGDSADDGGEADGCSSGRRRQGHQEIPRSAGRRGGTPCRGGFERLRSRTRCAGAEQALQACRRLQHLSQATRCRRR